MDSVEYADLNDLVRRAEGLRVKLAQKGIEFNSRTVHMYLRNHLKSSDEAKALIEADPIL
jgi:hypothetical protein